MTAVVDIEHPSIVAIVLAGALPIPLPELEPEAELDIIVPDFDFKFSTDLCEITSPLVDSNTIFARSIFDRSVKTDLLLTGELVDGGTIFQIKETSLQFTPTRELARADFVASTLNASFALAREVRLQIPQIALDLNLKFELPLLETAQLLQTRQTAYRLMVIERATGLEFRLPQRFSGEEIETISFVYHAIVDRSFLHIFTAGLRIDGSANEQGAASLAALLSRPMKFGPERVSKILLGKSIELGNATATIEDPYVEDSDRIEEALRSGDGHEVGFEIRSLTNQARYELPKAPRLPKTPWDPNIRALINLESQLDARLIERYNALAAATLDGLTEEEKAVLIARPELDEEAFMMEDWNQEET
jgi:hypothetical protein